MNISIKPQLKERNKVPEPTDKHVIFILHGDLGKPVRYALSKSLLF